METVRAFIAVDIGDEIRAGLDELQRVLKKVHADVRWVRLRNIHLTLVFLGTLPTEKLEPLKTALEQAVTGKAAFELTAAGTGFFGRANHPRVIWAGITASPELTALQHTIVEALLKAEIQFDNKPFKPHLTLGRFKGPGHRAALLERLTKYADAPLGHTRIGRIDLIKSDLKPQGAEYTVLHRFPLHAH